MAWLVTHRCSVVKMFLVFIALLLDVQITFIRIRTLAFTVSPKDKQQLSIWLQSRHLIPSLLYFVMKGIWSTAVHNKGRAEGGAPPSATAYGAKWRQ